MNHEQYTNHIIDCPGHDCDWGNNQLTASGIDRDWFYHHWLPAI